ncbi:MAG: cytochrome c biogenesis protein CcdA [Candidatus Poribacteria bacterium]|nr:cytochrome c biogenesis protein CcdA [Candidatus Poribacteria bacterium]
MRLNIHKKKCPQIALLILVVATPLAIGQFNPFTIADSVVTVDAEINPPVVRAGEVLMVKTKALIKPGFHIFAINKQSVGPVASKVTIKPENLISAVGRTLEPTPITKHDQGFQVDVYFHEGTITFETPVKLTPTLNPGEYSLIVELLYQACDPRICYPPKTAEMTVPFSVEEGSPRNGKTELATIGVAVDDNSINLDDAIAKGMLYFIFLAVSMGFLALLTPCVFPMIPITISYFIKQGGDEGKKPLTQAFVYSLGIIITYTVLGLLLAITLGASGANQLAASPWVNLFIGFLFIYFAFSLFGMYEIQLPATLRQFSLKREGRGGYVGTLFMALTFTLTSFTCTVQFVGLLLVAAVQGDWLWPLIGMLFFSAAFAIPFFFLALFPQYLAKIPKSGGWLNSVKVVMGFLELAASCKFLSNVDLVWDWGIFTRSSVLATWVVIAFLTGLYLIGKLRLSHDSELETISVPRLVLSIVLFTFSLYMSTGLLGHPLHSLIDAYLPPDLHSRLGHTPNAEVSDNSLPWVMEFEEGLKQSEQTGKPMFVNFTGYTCTNCRWMESNMFKDPQIVSRLKQFVLIELFTDGGANKDKNQQMEIDRFGTTALPFYVLLSPEDREITRFPGLTRNKNRFIEFLDQGLVWKK